MKYSTIMQITIRALIPSTAPVTGRYQLSCGLKINEIDKDSDYYQGQIVVSNNSIDIFNVRTAQVFNEDSTYYRWTVSMLVDMDAIRYSLCNF